MQRHTIACGATGLVVLVAGLLGPVPAARAATCTAATSQDFDDDGHADLVVARTDPPNLAGVVELRMSGGTTQTISAAGLGFPLPAGSFGDAFGTSVHIASIDEEDNCPDLVIGAPDTPGGGAVYLVRGNGRGVSTSAVRIESPAPDLHFGASVAAMDLPLTRVRVLVGAPWLDLGGRKDAGGLYVYDLDDAAPSGAPALLDYSDFGAAPHSNDRLGRVLDVTSNHVTLGVPYRNVGTKMNAGEVVGFSFVDEPGEVRLADWTVVNQDTPGAPGTAEADDRFGSSVDFAGAETLVGVPGEDLGGKRNVGVVVKYAELGNHTAGRWQLWHQDSAGIPGGNEAGDQFGYAVALRWVQVMVDGDPQSRLVYVVGAPYEDVGTIGDAGSITVIAPGVLKAFALNQRSGLPGTAERGDQLGAAFGDLPGEYSGPYYGGDGLIVGVRYENVGKVKDAGVFTYTRTLLPKGKGKWVSHSNFGAPIEWAYYGWTLPRA